MIDTSVLGSTEALFIMLRISLSQKSDYSIVSWGYNKIPVQINYINSWTVISK